MQTVRCAVLADDFPSAVTAEIESLLARQPGAAVTGGRELPQAGADFAAVVLVAASPDIDTLTRRIEELRRRCPAAAVLAAVGRAGSADLEALLAAGATDFIALPVDAGELVARLRRALGIDSPCRRPKNAAGPAIRGLVYASSPLAETAARLETMAGCDANVLILGETGTGKEICAQAVHYLSARASRPWVAVNCGAIPADLVEAELFGHVKGAYTTALASRAGLVREAECGTLFLDDIDCLPLAAQAKLLRFLQEREYRPVGSSSVQRADVRVIAASNRDLQGLAQRGGFRPDLYFRLNVLRVNLPPLRERRDDIAVLALHFIRLGAREFHKPVSGLTPAALRRLLAHDWPGNVRELRHVIERAVLMTRHTLLDDEDVEIDGAMQFAGADEDDSFRSAKLRAVNSFERAYLERMLVAHEGNVTRAAEASKKDRRAFFELMRKYDIRPARFRRANAN